MMHFPILSFLIWWPVLGAIALLLADKLHESWVKTIAIVVAIVEFVVSLGLIPSFDTSTAQMQFMENLTWIPEYKIHYALGIDGFSLALLLLTTFTTLIVVLAGCRAIKTKLSQYMANFLITQGVIIGVFCALDAILFYVFWEVMLIPMFLSIGMWGGQRRVYASIKFFLYTFLGSVLMFVAILYLHSVTGSFVIQDFYANLNPIVLQISPVARYFIFFAFLASFAVKVPMWPVHTWLPDAHTEAPAGGSVVLAALMLKLGVYGFIRFLMPITPFACQHLDWMMMILALIAIVYIGFVSIAQTDMKKLIAYSSIAHMGFAVLGCFMVYEIMTVTGSYKDAYLSLEGAMIQMIAHGFSSGALFLGVGLLQRRLFTREISAFGGVAKTMPILSAFMVLFAMSNVGLPGTAGFVGEFLVVLSAFQASFWIAALAATTMVLAAAYTLWMVKRVFFGPVVSQEVRELQDISAYESMIFVLLAAGVLILGLYPQGLMNMLHASVQHLLTDSIYYQSV